jgi:hypothetical protein
MDHTHYLEEMKDDHVNESRNRGRDSYRPSTYILLTFRQNENDGGRRSEYLASFFCNR